MPHDDARVKRTLHFKFSFPTADPAQLLAMMKAAEPFFAYGGMKVRLMQNVDDPARFIQVVDYETPEALELNRQQIVADPRVQAYLQAWRTLVPGGIDVEVFREVEPR
jgi:hypothetical protein